MAENKEIDVETMMTNFEKMHDKIKFRAFGKVTLGGRITMRKSEENNTEGDAETEFNEKVRKAKKEIEEIAKTTNVKVGKIWDVRKKVLGKRKSETQATAIINPQTTNLVVSKAEIKEVVADYCKNTLANNVPKETLWIK